ncbi:MAG: hypothetical protein SVU32_02470 [Candidatus Nanohaloarchaea archaeon]|nr:hypothetical protein [Candidatus Nanohaloarchaea archaeon]
MIAVFFFAFIMLLTVGSINVIFSVERTQQRKSSLAYNTNVQLEQLLNAQCATRSRAVFYRSAVVGGKLNCINTSATTLIEFKFDPECNQRASCFHWRVKPSSGEISVAAITESTFDEHFLTAQRNEVSNRRYVAPVTYYNANQDRFEPGIMRVVVK